MAFHDYLAPNGNENPIPVRTSDMGPHEPRVTKYTPLKRYFDRSTLPFVRSPEISFQSQTTALFINPP
jgi:hypothetical protein